MNTLHRHRRSVWQRRQRHTDSLRLLTMVMANALTPIVTPTSPTSTGFHSFLSGFVVNKRFLILIILMPAAAFHLTYFFAPDCNIFYSIFPGIFPAARLLKYFNYRTYSLASCEVCLGCLSLLQSARLSGCLSTVWALCA